MEALIPNLQGSQEYLDRVFETYKGGSDMLDRHTGSLLVIITSSAGLEFEKLKNISKDINIAQLQDGDKANALYNALSELEKTVPDRLKLIDLIEANHKVLVDYFGSHEHNSADDEKFRVALNRYALSTLRKVVEEASTSKTELEDVVKNKNTFIIHYLASNAASTVKKIELIENAVAHAKKSGK